MFPECSSLIEILLISEDKNIIKFKCINKDCGIKNGIQEMLKIWMVYFLDALL